MRVPKWFEEWFNTKGTQNMTISRQSWFSAIEVALRAYKKGLKDGRLQCRKTNN